MHSLEKLEDCFIAGGAVLSYIRKEAPNDYDIYPKSPKGLESALTSLAEDCLLVSATNRAMTFKHKTETGKDGKREIYQLVLLGYCPTAEDVFNTFDFAACMAAYDCDTGEFIYDPRFTVSLASKELGFNPKTKYPYGSLMRVMKYREKGFSPSLKDMALLGIAVGADPIKSWDDLEQQLGGVYGASLTFHEGNKNYVERGMVKIGLNVESRDNEIPEFTFDNVIAVLEQVFKFTKLVEDHDPPSEIPFQTDIIPVIQAAMSGTKMTRIEATDTYIQVRIHTKELVGKSFIVHDTLRDRIERLIPGGFTSLEDDISILETPCNPPDYDYGFKVVNSEYKSPFVSNKTACKYEADTIMTDEKGLWYFRDFDSMKCFVGSKPNLRIFMVRTKKSDIVEGSSLYRSYAKPIGMEIDHITPYSKLGKDKSLNTDKKVSTRVMEVLYLLEEDYSTFISKNGVNRDYWKDEIERAKQYAEKSE